MHLKRQCLKILVIDVTSNRPGIYYYCLPRHGCRLTQQTNMCDERRGSMKWRAISARPRLFQPPDAPAHHLLGRRVLLDLGPSRYFSPRHVNPHLFSQTQCRIWYRRPGIEYRSTNQNRPFRKSRRPTRRTSDLDAILE